MGSIGERLECREVSRDDDRQRVGSAPTVRAGTERGAVPATTFKAGEIVASRWKIVRFLAQGGMGEVYEAEDIELGERVALKTVRPEVAEEAGTLDRFKREIQLARKIAHPNVCRLFDLGFHTRGEGERTERVVFLTMELLEGEPLAQRIGKGPMPLAEARAIATQVAAALDAAHAAGIIHRDLKPDNILIVAEGGVTRAVVTDFGLARTHTGTDAFRTGTGGFLGTPAYMAPEQVEAGVLGPAVDVYAFGILLYELATGQLPFAAETPLALAVRRLTHPPIPPTTYRTDLDPRWERAILRCLERQPERRYARAGDAVAALSQARRLRDLLPPWAPFAGVGAAVGVLTLGGLLVFGGKPPGKAKAPGHASAGKPTTPAARKAEPRTPVKLRSSIAVLGFRDVTARGGGDVAGPALEQMVLAALRSDPSVRVVPPERVQRARQDLGLAGPLERLPVGAVARLRAQLGCDALLVGTVQAKPRRIDATISWAADKRAPLSVSQPPAQPPDDATLAGLVTEAALASLAGKAPPAEARPELVKAAREALPRIEALRSFVEGTLRLTAGDAGRARALLERAAQLDKDHLATQVALSEALLRLGASERANAAALRALDLGPKLDKAGRLRIELRHAFAARMLPRAVEILQTLTTLEPDEPEHALALAEVLLRAARPTEARRTLEALAALPEPLGQDPRVALGLGAAYAQERDVPAALEALTRAAARAGALGMRGTLADARLLEADLRFERSELDLARQSVGEALRLYEALRLHGSEVRALGLLARLDAELGHLASARKAYEALVARAHDTDAAVQAEVLADLALVLARAGELAEARKVIEQVLALGRDATSEAAIALGLEAQGALALRAGEVDRGREALEEASRDLARLGLGPRATRATLTLGELELRAGRPEEARRRIEAAVARAGEGPLFALAKARQADALVELGQLEPALGAARAAIEAATRGHRPDGVATAHAAHARVLLAMGKLTDASGAIERAVASGEKSESLDVRLEVALVAARLRLQVREPTELQAVRDALEAALAEAHRAGALPAELETRILLGLLELRLGRGEAARARLGAVEKAAREAHLGAIARHAEAAGRSAPHDKDPMP